MKRLILLTADNLRMFNLTTNEFDIKRPKVRWYIFLI
jgi:hypothetical protein